MVMSRALASNSENFYFSPDSGLNFRNSYQSWGKLAEEQKVTGKKQIGGGNPVLIGLREYTKFLPLIIPIFDLFRIHDKFVSFSALEYLISDNAQPG